MARYDRALARALLPGADKTVVPAQTGTLCITGFLPLAMIDSNEAVAELRATRVARRQCNPVAPGCLLLIQILPIECPHRWDRLASQHGLWIPDNQYTDELRLLPVHDEQTTFAWHFRFFAAVGFVAMCLA